MKVWVCLPTVRQVSLNTLFKLYCQWPANPPDVRCDRISDKEKACSFQNRLHILDDDTVNQTCLYTSYFHPTADSYEPLNFKLREYPLKKTEIVTMSRATLRSEFGQYDYLMGIEYAPAIAMRIGKPLNVFYSAATDLSHYPFSEYQYATGAVWKTEEKYLADLQFYGIKYAHNISMNMAPLPIENALIKIGFKGHRFEALPYLYMRLWANNEVLNKSNLKATLDEVRSRFDVLIFHHIHIHKKLLMILIKIYRLPKELHYH